VQRTTQNHWKDNLSKAPTHNHAEFVVTAHSTHIPEPQHVLKRELPLKRDQYPASGKSMDDSSADGP
jgi:hypothetical protein